MNISNTNLFRFFFALVDFLLINIVYLALLLNLSGIQENYTHKYTILFVVSNIAWMLCAYIAGLYITDSFFNFMQFAKRTFQSFILFVAVISLFLFLNSFPFSKLFVSLAIIGIGTGLFAGRILFRWAVVYYGKQVKLNNKIVLLGYNEVSRQLANYFSINSESVLIEGYFEDVKNVNELSIFPILGDREECVSYSMEHNVKEIYSTISPEKNVFIYKLAQTAEQHMIRFRFVPDFKSFVNHSIHMDMIESMPVLSYRSEPLEGIVAGLKKRLFDIVFSVSIMIFLLSWLVPLIAILVKLSSKGPVFFVQLRSGKNNKDFWCYKFRTLTLNPDADSKQVTRNDTRLTRVGTFLRKSSLDELPQFFNVLLGNMSVVGPRPHMLKHTKDFSVLSDEYMVRHYVKPGITGWAQVNGFRGEIKEAEQLRRRVACDIWYLENWSMWLDLRIIFLTFYVTFFKGDKNAF